MRIRVPVEMLNETASNFSKTEATIVQNNNSLIKIWNGLWLEAKSKNSVEQKVRQAQDLAGRLSTETSALSKYVNLVNNRFVEADGKAAQNMALASKALIYASGQQKSGIKISLRDFVLPLTLIGAPALASSVVILGWISKIIKKEKAESCLLRGNQTRSCSAHITKDGTKIVASTDRDRKLQVAKKERIERFWNNMPRALTKHTSEIQILDYSNPDDQYWSEKTNTNHRSAATASFGVIHIYPNETNIPLLGDLEGHGNTFSDVLHHEAAHNLDRSLSGDHSWFSDSDTWRQAVTNDNNGFVTSYAESMYEGYINDNADSGHYAEDFAESVKLLYRDRNSFAENYPKRYEILMGILEGR